MKYPFDFEPFGRAFAESAGRSVAERLGAALLESAKYRPIDWPELFLLPTVGPVPANGASFYTSGSGISYDEALYAQLKAAHPEHQAALEKTDDIMITALILQFAQLNGVQLANQTEIYELLGIDSAQVKMDMQKICAALDCEIFDPRYLTEEAFIKSLYY